MVLYSDLRNWVNGNISEIDRAGLITIARYFEQGKPEACIEFDMEVDDFVTSIGDN